ncbi:hypothetical protein [Desulfobacula sp.]|uniref:hypothetical protein n=1 Tax=Desulfobacula sp. TaxID=2593537 RepID=UPI0025C728EA|nr:hypothetical protein [Desulfobacula sp.]
MIISKFFLTFLCIFLLSGCSTSSEFHIENLAKTDIDDVSEIHMHQVVTLLRTLTVKLYKKNPYELQKVQEQTIDSRLNQIFICPVDKKYKELEFKEGRDAILLGFEPEFEGDRVFALMVGLYTMIHTSYNQKCELFMLDYLNAQNLYNSARNIEILVWRLNTRKNNDGRLFILTNSLKGEVKNLTYERLFGKLISLQDTMALIVSDRTGRIIKKMAQIAGMAFLPIGI